MDERIIQISASGEYADAFIALTNLGNVYRYYEWKWIKVEPPKELQPNPENKPF